MAATNNKPSTSGLSYWNADGTYAPDGNGDAKSSNDPFGNLQSATDAGPNQGGDAPPPGDAPDITDKLIRAKRAAAANAALTGQGRASTMNGSSTLLTSSLGSPQLGKTMLGG